MRKIIKNNQIRYKYSKDQLAYNDKMSIICFVICIIFFLMGLVVSVIYGGEGPMLIGALGIIAILFDLISMFYSIYEIYEYNIYKRITRNMLLLQIGFLIFMIIL